VCYSTTGNATAVAADRAPCRTRLIASHRGPCLYSAAAKLRVQRRPRGARHRHHRTITRNQYELGARISTTELPSMRFSLSVAFSHPLGRLRLARKKLQSGPTLSSHAPFTLKREQIPLRSCDSVCPIPRCYPASGPHTLPMFTTTRRARFLTRCMFTFPNVAPSGVSSRLLSCEPQSCSMWYPMHNVKQ